MAKDHRVIYIYLSFKLSTIVGKDLDEKELSDEFPDFCECCGR